MTNILTTLKLPGAVKGEIARQEQWEELRSVFPIYLALARHLSAQGRPLDALELLFEAIGHNPHALALHQTIWQTLSAVDLPTDLLGSYIELTRDAIFYVDPHVCLRCRYRSTELLWQCPHCHEWNTFVDERIAPAKETAEV